MIKSNLTCSITIYDQKRNEFRTCGAKAPFVLIVRGDQLFACCSRHNARVNRAFPGIERSPARV